MDAILKNLHMPLQLLLVIGASFLIGLEMEGRKAGGKTYSPGGVRTFPLICLSGFLLGLLGGANPAPFVAGLAILGLLLGLLYRIKTLNGNYGMTTEAFAVVTYILGGLVAAADRHPQMPWLVAALTVLMVLLQELKDPLERLVKRIGGGELITIAKFLLLSAVILPLMPNRAFTAVGLNPWKIWWVVVAVTGVSYVSYLVQTFARGVRGDLLLVGLLGGAYSSTMTTIVLARQSRHSIARPVATAGTLLAASGMMNIRLLVLIALFSPALARTVLWPLSVAAGAGIVVGTVVCLLSGRRLTAPADKPQTDAAGSSAGWMAVQPAEADRHRPSSPLELRVALGFAALFTIVLVLSHVARARFGEGGLLALGGLSGLGIVDPFVLSLTQAGGPSLSVAGLAVIVATVANHLAKAIYAIVLGERTMARLTLVMLLGLSAVTVAAWWAFAH